MRCSIEILRRQPDGSAELIHRYSLDGFTSEQIVEIADIELRASEAARGANGVAIYDHQARKLAKWKSLAPAR